MKSKSLAEITTFLVVFAVLMGVIYCLGRQKKPVKYTSIPEKVETWITQIGSTGTDIGLVNVGNGPFDWDNTDDFGSKEESGYSCLDVDDPNFIIFYLDDAAGKWRKFAEIILQEANRAIPDLASFMGRFPEPSSSYGRRLPIYLPDTEQEYFHTCGQLCGSSFNLPSSGLYVHGVGLHGPISYGIVLHPDTFKESVHPDYTYHFVLRHEMNHFVFYSNLDYGHENSSSHKLWESEGLADFFAYNLGDHTPFVAGRDSIDFINTCCNLDDEFVSSETRFGNPEYWAGESFYKFLKETTGVNNTARFVRFLYEEPFDTAIRQFIPDTLDVHQMWVESLLAKVEGQKK